MTVTSLAESHPPPTVPPMIEIALAELARQLSQTYALVSAARLALGIDNKYTVDELLDLAEDQVANIAHLKQIGDYFGVDTERKYEFEQQGGE